MNEALTEHGRGRELPPELFPLAPFLHLVRGEGALEAAELIALQRRVARARRLDRDAREALRAWLEPGHPPTAAELEYLLDIVRQYGGGFAESDDLAALGARIAANAPADADAARRAVVILQDALGLPAVEAARSLVQPGAGPARRREVPPPFASDAMRAFLFGDQLPVRERTLRILSTDAFRYVEHADAAAYRKTVLGWCRELAREGLGAMAYPREFGGSDDVAGSLAAFEALGHHDLSLLVKFGVQFGLFGGAIRLLGTRHHHERYLRDVVTLVLPGCFAMTETDHGSNVREIRTMAVFDQATDEFVIDTPDVGARKDYIGNAAAHGRLAVVFAQLRSLGTDHGVHAFVVPIRDEAGRPLTGVRLEDCGPKGGLNGVDNGRIAFDAVRVPRTALLDRFGSVAPDGAYTSPIASPSRRFFTMLGTLVAGRIGIACASLSAARSGLTIAVRYAAGRRQFGPEGGPEIPILDYTDVQLRLMPRLAAAYALNFALHDVARSLAAAPSDTPEIETLAAGLKAWTSDWAVRTLQHCREVCGGQGFLAENRITAIRADADIFTTFEGANPVLFQLVAKGRLVEYRQEFGELRLWNVARLIAARAARGVGARNPIAARRTDRDHLLDPAFHAAALRYREDRLLDGLARRLQRRLNAGMDSFDALNECQDHAIELGRAFTERWVLERFHAALEAADPALRPWLDRLAALYALDRIRAAAAWYLETGWAEAGKIRAIRRNINELCVSVRDAAPTLVDAFGIPEPVLAAPIARQP